MSLSRFKRLVAQMPKISSIVNQFDSPEIQRDVLQALVRAFEAEDTPTDAADALHLEDLNEHKLLLDCAPAFFDESDRVLIGADAGPTDADESSIHS